MKFLKWLLIVVLVIAGLLLVIPLFLPSTMEVSAETDISLAPETVFHNVATYTGRQQWDPWLSTDSAAKVTISSEAGYVGSSYSWDGEEIGTGKMMVDSVVPGRFIAAKIWFGDFPDPYDVEWDFEKTEDGTHVTWQFISEGKYPFGKLMNLMMKGGLQKSYNEGIENFREYIEMNPPAMYSLSEIMIDDMDEVTTMVLPVEGTMDEITTLFSEGFPTLFGQLGRQGIQPAGPAFAYYLDFDEATGFSHILLGVPVSEPGMEAGGVVPRVFPAMKAVVAMHQGEYQYFRDSYAKMSTYIEENGIEITGEAFEIYHVTQMESDNPMDWKTLIGFPLK